MQWSQHEGHKTEIVNLHVEIIITLIRKIPASLPVSLKTFSLAINVNGILAIGFL